MLMKSEILLTDTVLQACSPSLINKLIMKFPENNLIKKYITEPMLEVDFFNKHHSYKNIYLNVLLKYYSDNVHLVNTWGSYYPSDIYYLADNTNNLLILSSLYSYSNEYVKVFIKNKFKKLYDGKSELPLYKSIIYDNVNTSEFYNEILNELDEYEIDCDKCNLGSILTWDLLENSNNPVKLILKLINHKNNLKTVYKWIYKNPALLICLKDYLLHVCPMNLLENSVELYGQYYTYLTKFDMLNLYHKFKSELSLKEEYMIVKYLTCVYDYEYEGELYEKL